jgi:hypothetical protein
MEFRAVGGEERVRRSWSPVTERARVEEGMKNGEWRMKKECGSRLAARKAAA